MIRTLGAANVVASNLAYTSLVAAIFDGHNSVCKTLLTHTKLPVDSQGSLGYTPLMWAARFGNEQMVDLLVSLGAQLNLKNAEGDTALVLAYKQGHWAIGAKLRNHGATTGSEL